MITRSDLANFFRFRGTLDRRAYVLVALGGVLVMHVTSSVIVEALFKPPWPPTLFIPLGAQVGVLGMGHGDPIFVLTVAIISIPFAWLGLAITVKRFRTIGWPLWLVVLFFVPIANIASFAIAAAWPEPATLPARAERNRRIARFIPADTFGAATLALIVTVALGTACTAFGTKILGQYGWGLFAAIPFAQGALSAYFLNVHGTRSRLQSVAVAELSVALTGLTLLAVALEGLFCIALAMPIAIAFAAIGGVLGHAISRSGGIDGAPASLLVLVFLAPAIMGAESVLPRNAPLYVVQSSVEIDASPAVVWRHVISFPDLPPPSELPFRLGIAFPERARIHGSGVGAIRYCEFSTGSFVEPITVWVPEHELAFNVVHNPEPMREWSPFGSIDTPHLHHYMESRRGEFTLIALPGGRTRLVGTTWYQHHLWPATYWALWSDAIVHQIHMRVLKHIKTISELSMSPSGRFTWSQHTRSCNGS